MDTTTIIVQEENERCAYRNCQNDLPKGSEALVGPDDQLYCCNDCCLCERTCQDEDLGNDEFHPERY